MPTAPAVKRAITAASSVHFPSSSIETTVPGRMPQEPAVGDATTFPIAALYSDTARALAMERFIKPPMIPPSWAYRFILKASPPVSPDSERVSGMDPAWIACRITCKFSRIRWYSTSVGSSISSAWSRRTSSESETPASSAAAHRAEID